jgi:hypothetical protein
MGAAQYEIAPGHYLRQANGEEIEFIKFYLERVKALLPVDANHWEMRFGRNGHRELLPTAEWRYHVVAYPELLDERVALALDLSPKEVEFGFEVIFSNPEKLWAHMYGYRSLLAHGHAAQFSTGDLAILKNHNCALGLLKDTVKSVLLHAPREPRFIADLKNCYNWRSA